MKRLHVLISKLNEEEFPTLLNKDSLLGFVSPELPSLENDVVIDDLFPARNFNTSPLNISGLEVGYDYEVIAVFTNASGDSTLDVTLNSEVTGYRNYEMKGLVSAASAAVGDADTAIELQNLIGTANPSLLRMSITGDVGDERYISSSYSADGAVLKQSSYWNNTIDEIDEITLTAANSVTCDAHIIVYRVPKAGDQGNWELVDTYSATGVNYNSSPTTIFTGLLGNSDKKYKIDIEYTSAANTTMGIRVNTDSSALYTRQNLRNKNGALAASNATSTSSRFSEENTAVTGVRNVSIEVDAETGVKRLLKTSFACSTNNGVDQQESACWYNDTVTEITGFTLVSDTSNVADVEAKLYKLKNTAVTGDTLLFEEIETVDISGDFSAGHTFTGLKGDSQTLYKVELLSDKGSNTIDIGIQPNSDAGSNYTNQHLTSIVSTAAAGSSTDTKIDNTKYFASQEITSEVWYIYPKSGENRPILGEISSQEVGNYVHSKLAAWWLNSVDEITSLKVFASSSSTITGTLKLSRLK